MSYCCIFCFCLFHFVLKLYRYLHLIVKFTIRSIMSIRFFSLLFIWTSCDDMVSLSRLRFISTLMFTEAHVRFPNDAQVMTSVSLSFTSPPSIPPSIPPTLSSVVYLIPPALENEGFRSGPRVHVEETRSKQ